MLWLNMKFGKKFLYFFPFFLKSKVNIASLGVRQIQKRVASSGFSKTVHIQVSCFLRKLTVILLLPFVAFIISKRGLSYKRFTGAAEFKKKMFEGGLSSSLYKDDPDFGIMI